MRSICVEKTRSNNGRSKLGEHEVDIGVTPPAPAMAHPGSKARSPLSGRSCEAHVLVVESDIRFT